MQSEKPKSVNETWCIHGKFIAGGSSNCRNETSGIEPTIVRPGALTETSRQRNHARTHASREPRGNQTMADSENRIRTSGNLRRQQFQNAETRTGDEGLILPVLTGGRQRENFWATRESKTWVRPHRARQKPDIGGKIRATNRDSGSKISVVKRNRSEGPTDHEVGRRKIRARQPKIGEDENQNASANLKNNPWQRQTQAETQWTIPENSTAQLRSKQMIFLFKFNKITTKSRRSSSSLPYLIIRLALTT
jgi:hypothetical protein